MVDLEPRGNTLTTGTFTKSVSMKLVHRKGDNFEKYLTVFNVEFIAS